MNEWSERPLGILLEELIDHRGKTPKKLGGTDFVDEGVPVVSAVHIKDGRVQWTAREQRYVPHWMFEKWMPVRLRKGDVLLTSEAPLGAVAQVPSDDDLVLSQRLFALRGKAGVLDSSFLRYFLESPTGQHRLAARATGTTASGIRQSQLVQVEVPLPLWDEQRRIAAVLEVLDDLVETNRRSVAALRALAVSTLDAASVRGDVVTFSQIAAQARDGVSGSALRAGTPYLGLEHFEPDGGGIAGRGDAGDVDSAKSRFRAGDLLYGKLRPYFRKFDRPGFDGVCSTEIWVLRPQPGWGAATLDAIVSRPGFTEFAMAGSGGTRMPRASWAHVETMPVAVPQEPVRSALNTQLEQIWRTRVALLEEVGELVRTRDELLPLLMSGAVRVSTSMAVV